MHTCGLQQSLSFGCSCTADQQKQCPPQPVHRRNALSSESWCTASFQVRSRVCAQQGSHRQVPSQEGSLSHAMCSLDAFLLMALRCLQTPRVVETFVAVGAPMGIQAQLLLAGCLQTTACC